MKTCIKCNSPHVVNSFFKLCHYCNKERLDERKPKLSHPIKPNPTAKTKSTNLQKSQLKKEIAVEWGLLCAGCNDRRGFLTLSHTIPISIRKDLELEKGNCNLECMGCHTVWEHGTVEQKSELLNFEDKIKYIKKVDPEYYERKFNKK